MKPTNVKLLDPNKVLWGLMRETSSVDIKEGLSNSLHPEGLYSIETFGRVGTETRDTTMSYIDVKLPIFNPTYFNALISLKSLYLEIIKGTAYAVWDTDEKDFIKSNLLEGETGISFFISHLEELEVKLTDSYKRKRKKELIDRYKPIALTSKVMVIPAGLRDVRFEPDGRTVEMEINDLYRKLIFRSRSIVVNKGDEESSIYDNVRWNLQRSFNDIDQYIDNQMKGKGGFWVKRVSTRGVVGGTRNVITARHMSCENADEYDGVDVNSADIGVYQALLTFQYVARYSLLNGWLSKVFTPGSNIAKLVDPKTLSYEYKEIKGEIVDKWMSSDGLTNLFNGFKDITLRHKPIMVSGSYLGLVYDDGEKVKIFGGLEELPEGYNKKNVRPLTYIELFYLECVKNIESKMLQITRYPITGRGSIFPAKIKLKTTSNSSKRVILDDYWEPNEECLCFPDLSGDVSYYDSMSIDSARVGLAGADFDGDQMNCNGINTEEAIAEIKAIMNKRSYYISGTGNFLYDPVVEPHLFLFRALSNGL